MEKTQKAKEPALKKPEGKNAIMTPRVLSASGAIQLQNQVWAGSGLPMARFCISMEELLIKTGISGFSSIANDSLGFKTVRRHV